LRISFDGHLGIYNVKVIPGKGFLMQDFPVGGYELTVETLPVSDNCFNFMISALADET
jgi:hypothetical protein